MHPRHYSAFWLAYAYGLVCLSSAWHERDDPPADRYPGEDLSMEHWLRLPERQRSALVHAYAQRTPPTRYTDSAERRRQEAA